MKLRQAYKGHVIEAMTFELRDLPGFTSEFYLEKHDGRAVAITQFFMPGIYKDSESAIQACMVAGRRKIDAGYSSGI
jgi:hypothetical protein